jgi:hypothetical protein
VNWNEDATGRCRLLTAPGYGLARQTARGGDGHKPDQRQTAAPTKIEAALRAGFSSNT